MPAFFLKKNFSDVPACAIFMSGVGTNAEKLLEFIHNNKITSFKTACLVTDRPKTSAAKRIAAKYGITPVEHDIVDFYKANGLDSLSIATEKGMAVREKWTQALREKLAPFNITFGVFAGFVPLTNIADDFPCLNVHPGDLTLENEKGQRILAGLHLLPLEKAIILGHKSVRSSVIVVQTVTKGGKEVDTGPVLGVSEPMMLNITDDEREYLTRIHDARKGKKRSEYRGDALEIKAEEYQNSLKEHGDWIVLPRVVKDFAEGAFAISGDGKLTRHGTLIKTCEYPEYGNPVNITL